MKKFISILLAIAIVIGVAPVQLLSTVQAEKENNYVDIPTREELLSEKTSIRPKDKKIDLDKIIDWNPTDDVYDQIHKSVVSLEEKRTGTVLNPLANPEAKVMSLSYLSSNSPLHSAVGGGQEGYKIYAFDNWQLLDKMVFWDGLIPNPEVTDAAHRNGVPMYGTIFFNWGSDGSMADKVLQQNSDGTYPVAKKLVDIAKYYGFDGYFINQESSTGKSFRDFLLYIKKYSKSIDYPIEMIWYDGGGSLSRNPELYEIDDEGDFPADMFFADFSWYNATSPGDTFEKNGLDKWDAYMGLELQKGGAYNTNQRKNYFIGEDNKTQASLGLFVPDTIIGMSQDGEDYHRQEQKFWVGHTNNPQTADDSENWSGIARFVADKTPILSLPFSTNFNTGHGRHWFIDGRKSLDSEWNGRSIQDVMPTWRWIINNESGNTINARYDFDEAFNGGTSLKFEGDLSSDVASTIQLYSMMVKATDVTKAKLALKQTGDAKVELGVHTSEDYSEVKYYPVEVTSNWKESIVDLSSLNGQTIYAISIKLTGNSETENSVNLGHLSIYDDDSKPQSPSEIAFDKVSYNTSMKAEALIHVNKVEGAKYYEVYHKLNDEWEIINSSSSNYIFLPEVKRDENSQGTQSEIMVVAVGENGVRSDGLISKFEWNMEISETTEPEPEPVNIMPLASIVKAPKYNAEGPENILTGTINNTADKWFYPGAATAEVKLDKPRTIEYWGIDHAGAGGESVNDGLMNTNEFKIHYKDENGEWKEAVHITDNWEHVTEGVFEEPITAQDWKLEVIDPDNGSPWGGLRIYNWRMYESYSNETKNVPMINANAYEQEDGKFTLTFTNGVPNATLKIYKENPNTNESAEVFKTAKIDDEGIAIISDVELEGNKGRIYYTSQLDTLDTSNILNLTYISTVNNENEEENTQVQAPIFGGYFRTWHDKSAIPDETRPNSFGDVPPEVDIVYVFPANMPEDTEFWDNLVEDYVPHLHAQGQKVIHTFGIDGFISEMKDKGFANNQEGYDAYAKYLYEEKVSKFNLDGLDIDYEATGLQGENFERAVGTFKALNKYMGPFSGTDKLLILDTNKRVLDSFIKAIANQVDFINLQIYGGNTEELDDVTKVYEELVSPDKLHMGISFYEEYGAAWGDTQGSPETSTGGKYAKWQPEEGHKGGMFAYAIDRDGKQFGDNSITETDYSWSIAYKQMMLEDSYYDDLTLAQKNYPQLNWDLGVLLNSELTPKDLIANLDRLPNDAKFEFINEPDLSSLGQKTVEIKVTYSDDTYDVLPARYVVKEDLTEPEEPVTPVKKVNPPLMGGYFRTWHDHNVEEPKPNFLGEVPPEVDLVYVFPDYTPDDSPFWTVLKEDYIPRLHAQGQKVILTYGVNTMIKDFNAKGYTNDAASYKEFAKFIFDEKIDKFNLDGIDLDYEINLNKSEDYQIAVGVTKELISLLGEEKLFILDTNKRSLDNYITEVAKDVDLLNLQVYADMTRRFNYYYADFGTVIPINKISVGFSFYEENDYNKWGDTEGTPETSRAGEYAKWQPQDGLKAGVFAYAIDRDGKQIGDNTISKTDYSWSIAYKNMMLQDSAYDELTLAERNYPQLDWDREVKQGTELIASDLIINKDRLPEDAEYSFIDEVDLSTLGKNTIDVKVRYSDGSEDILPARIIVIEGEKQPVEIEGYINYSTNLRETPNGKVISTIPAVTKVTGTEEGNWVKLTYDGVEGYVYKDLVYPNPLVEGYINYSTNLRETPNGEVISTIPAVTKVSGIQEGNWVKLTYNGVEGYVYIDLVYPNPLTIEGYINYTTNFRQTPNGKAIATIPGVTKVTGTQEGNWVKVTYNGVEGYVYKDLVYPNPLTIKGYINYSTNLRGTPNGKVIATIPGVTKVTGTQEGNWVKVSYKGQEGYVYKDLISENPLVKVVVKAQTNLRQTPNGKIITTISKSTQVSGIQEGNWIKINYNGVEGYVYSEFLEK